MTTTNFVGEGAGQAPDPFRPSQRGPAGAPLSDLDLVNRCIGQLKEAAAIQREREPKWEKMFAKAKADLETALEHPAVLAAFGDAFSHPRMVAARLEVPTSDALDRAAHELFGVRDGLKDQRAAVEMRALIGGLQRLNGPSPWDTFYVSPGDPDKALMPLYGCRTPDVLAVGRLEGGGQLLSDGGQALFYPLGGYERFAEATSVVVAQSLADGLAIDAALGADTACAVIVASAPDGVSDVCFGVSQELVNRSAVASPADRLPISVVAALGQSDARDNDAVERLSRDAARTGTSIVRPSERGRETNASWPLMEAEAIAEMVKAAGALSRQRLQDVAAEADDRGDGRRDYHESVWNLRASTRDIAASLANETSTKVEKRSHSIGHRM